MSVARARTRYGRLGFVLGLAAFLCLASCDLCGVDQHPVRFLDVEVADVRIAGQSLYPSEEADYSYSRSKNSRWDPDFEGYYRLFRNPSAFSGDVLLGWGVYLRPPWCEDTIGTREDCATVGLGVLIEGPQRKGETYGVAHGEAECASGDSEVCAWFDEEPIYSDFSTFPEYHSVSATGTSTVVAEHPFVMNIDVEFRDGADAVRQVTATFSVTGYREECMADDW